MCFSLQFIFEEKAKRWRAEIHKEYFYVIPNGEAGSKIDYYNVADNTLFAIGNYFQTEEEAQIYADKFKDLLANRTREA